MKKMGKIELRVENRIYFWDNVAKLTPHVVMRLLFFVISLIIFGWTFFPYLIRLLILNKVVISPEINPLLYAAWVQPPVPVYLKVYLFNVMNPEEIENGLLPKLEEVGPYVYEEFRRKTDVTLDDDLDTATYSEKIRYHFHSELSGSRSENDVVTLINVPFAAAAVKIERDVPWPLNHVAHMILLNYREPLFVRKTVEEALFQGWKVPFLEKIEEEIGLSLVENNRFGFFLGLNDTSQGPYTIKRGLHGDKQLFGRVVKYKNQSRLNYWGRKETSCNKIEGTDGSIFPPFVERDSILRLFNAELCRSLHLTFNDLVVVEGIHGYRFTAPQSLLEDPRMSQENKCFCEHVNSEPEKCLGRGVLNLGPCRDGAPVAMSNPHFLDADPKYLGRTSKGLKPEREKHETYLNIEPLTGAVLQASKKIQVNLILKRVSSIPSLRMVPDMLFPLIWADEGAKLDDKSAQQLKAILIVIQLTKNVGKGVTVLLALVTFVIMANRLCQAKPDKSSMRQEEKLGNEVDKFLSSTSLAKNDNKNDYR